MPKDKLKMWLGQDTASHMIYIDGPNGSFAVLEIVDTLYNIDKVVRILDPLLTAKSHSSHFKGLWKINQKRDEYLGKVYLVKNETLIYHSFPAAPIWRILSFEKRLLETERSYNLVDSVKTSGGGFSIINLSWNTYQITRNLTIDFQKIKSTKSGRNGCL